jgi:RNA polymerase sigma-70 factor (ECF subfamily)
MHPNSDHSDSFAQQVRLCAQRICESQGAALGGLFDLTSQRLVRLAATITRNQHDAEDAVQVALTRVAERPELLASADQPWHYLLQIVRNNALQILRRKRPSASLVGLDDLLFRFPVDQVERSELFRAVWSALRKIPTEQGEVVVLKLWEEMTFHQIGEVLQISAATAASRYRYGLGKLAILLGRRSGEVVHG